MAPSDPAFVAFAEPPGLPAAKVYRRSFAPLRVIAALVLREVSTRYVDTPGGYLWAVLEPVGTIIMMALGFSLLTFSPPLGSSFILFYASGMMPLQVFRTIENDVSFAIRYSRPLLLFPSVTWLDAVLARFVLAFLTNTLLMVLILGGAILFAGDANLIDPLLILEAIVAVSFLGLGIGMVNAYLKHRSALYAQIWNIGTKPLLLISGVLYVVESLPRWMQDLFWWNPIVHLIGKMRSGIYASYDPHIMSMTYVYAVFMVTMLLGLIFLRAYSRDLINGN